MKCIADTLTTNKHIKVLNIEENYLKPEDVKAISDMLQVNSTIKMLNLKECRIGPQGNALAEITIHFVLEATLKVPNNLVTASIPRTLRSLT